MAPECCLWSATAKQFSNSQEKSILYAHNMQENQYGDLWLNIAAHYIFKKNSSYFDEEC